MITDYIITKGDTYKEALHNGLSSLNLTEDKVKIEILDEKRAFYLKKDYLN